ncbi:MAG: DSD1 family PLP-dependent enzyme, partial [Candidatus Aenigmarchaeota archaeon]|nr:DSD1 family PLP-dependent enzyme [Candidatus Aenigmarchaeota archaeon]
MNDMKHEMTKEELDTPCLVIDFDILERNLKQMANSVQTNLRPHIKTHKCPILAKKQLETGAIGITCAKVGEAEVMAKAGINDILIANQIVGKRKIARLLDLANENFVRVIVDNPTNVEELATAAEARKMELHVLVELDVGLHRCGV